MSGLKPPALSDFYRSLHARGESTTSLAAAIGRARSVVTKILNGDRRRGPAWAKLKPLLTAKEIALLDVVQSPTWNTRRLAKRPRWTPAKAAQLTAA
jgi:hypothetical protein